MSYKSTDNKKFNIITNGTVVIPLPTNPPGKLVLEKIIINTKGASSNTITIYDSNPTLGANPELKIGKIDTTVVPDEWEYCLTMYNGIYLVVETGTAPDATVIYAETP